MPVPSYYTVQPTPPYTPPEHEYPSQAYLLGFPENYDMKRQQIPHYTFRDPFLPSKGVSYQYEVSSDNTYQFPWNPAFNPNNAPAPHRQRSYYMQPPGLDSRDHSAPVYDRYQHALHMSPMQHIEKPGKREQVTGGVSAELDYDQEQMSEYVASMSSSLIYQNDHFQSPTTYVPSQFKKWVSQVLSSTRLPSSTILLALTYLQHRMRNHITCDGSLQEQTYRYLTIALVFANKFLDDNTFTNKSWAEVTGLSISEINRLELEWFNLIEGRLNSEAFNKGWKVWEQSWKTWEKSAALKAEERRQQTLYFNRQQRQSSYQRQSTYTPYPPPSPYDGRPSPESQHQEWEHRRAVDSLCGVDPSSTRDKHRCHFRVWEGCSHPSICRCTEPNLRVSSILA